jgi:hypothetical protein
MTSCGCSSSEKPLPVENVYVHCPVSIPALNAKQVLIPKKSYMWHQLHQSICHLEQRSGVVLPVWTDQFYQESFPNLKCIGQQCNVYL